MASAGAGSWQLRWLFPYGKDLAHSGACCGTTRTSLPALGATAGCRGPPGCRQLVGDAAAVPVPSPRRAGATGLWGECGNQLPEMLVAGELPPVRRLSALDVLPGIQFANEPKSNIYLLAGLGVSQSPSAWCPAGAGSPAPRLCWRENGAGKAPGCEQLPKCIWDTACGGQPPR